MVTDNDDPKPCDIDKGLTIVPISCYWNVLHQAYTDKGKTRPK